MGTQYFRFTFDFRKEKIKNILALSFPNHLSLICFIHFQYFHTCEPLLGSIIQHFSKTRLSCQTATTVRHYTHINLLNWVERVEKKSRWISTFYSSRIERAGFSVIPSMASNRRVLFFHPQTNKRRLPAPLLPFPSHLPTTTSSQRSNISFQSFTSYNFSPACVYSYTSGYSFDLRLSACILLFVRWSFILDIAAELWSLL